MAKITLKGNPVNTIGELPAVDSKAPSFTLIKSDLSEASLSDYQGKKVILNIFPSIDTSTCALSVKKFNDEIKALDDVVVLNISLDLPFAQKRFYEEEKIQHGETLSAYRSEFPDDYGVRLIDSPLKGLTARAIVLLDEDQVVRYTELVEDISSSPNFQSVLDKVKQI